METEATDTLEPVEAQEAAEASEVDSSALQVGKEALATHETPRKPVEVADSKPVNDLPEAAAIPEASNPTQQDASTETPNDKDDSEAVPSAAVLNGSNKDEEDKKLVVEGAQTRLKRTPSLEVETGSFSAPETTKVELLDSKNEEDIMLPASSAQLEAAISQAEPLHTNRSAVSEDGTVVLHSTPGSQQLEEVGEEKSGFHRDKGEPEFDSITLDDNESAQPQLGQENGGDQSESLQQNSADATDSQEGSNKNSSLVIGASVSRDTSGIDSSRPGVTSSPPRSPQKGHPVSASSQPDQQEAPSLNGSRHDASSVAEDLAEAEARAEVAALASQRNSSMGKKMAEDLTIPDDNAPFTEEALQSDDKEPTPPALQEATARPFSPPPGGVQSLTERRLEENDAFEPPEFRGLVFHDGVDSLGRPVIVVNADAVSPKVSRKAACAYMLQRLEPIVVQGPYVLVLLNTGKTSRSNKLPAGWLASSYRGMSYPFKKNVKYVVLVRPSATLNFMLAIMRPLISKKAYVKLKKVDNLTAIAQATNSEVTLQHLGPKFAASALQSIVADENLSRGNGYQMPNLGSVELSQQ